MTAMNGYLGGSLEQATEIYRVGLNTTRLLLALGDLMIGWLLGRQAEVALDRLDQGGLAPADEAFYRGKLAVAGFFAATVLPGWRPSARSPSRPRWTRWNCRTTPSDRASLRTIAPTNSQRR